ncbi:hypothetical protein Scep_001067 [Stephania cephalantha]|uniref:Uncharacterized protein n=1 Tax=Stephania cephalantha TaxID=152367 RepID=A0AAP0L7H3_9MAGN
MGESIVGSTTTLVSFNREVDEETNIGGALTDQVERQNVGELQNGGEHGDQEDDSDEEDIFVEDNASQSDDSVDSTFGVVGRDIIAEENEFIEELVLETKVDGLLLLLPAKADLRLSLLGFTDLEEIEITQNSGDELVLFLLLPIMNLVNGS